MVGATAVVLLVAVVAVRDDTAAVPADLAVAQDEPSPEPSPEPSQDGPVVLAANGLPGLRLGAEGRDGDAWLIETPAGCRMVWDDGGGAAGSDVPPDQPPWQTAAWVVDEEVVSVFISGWDESTEPSDLLRTWLGPTIGSPIQTAQELPGARTVTERPFGGTGPVVHVVTVPERGVEVVYSDLSAEGRFSRSEPGGGRISTVEVRRPAGRACALGETLLATDATSGPGPVVDADGVGLFRLGTPVADLVGAEGVVSHGSAEGSTDDDGGGPCRSFTLDGGPEAQGAVTAVAQDGVVTEVQVWHPGLSTSFGLPAGADVDDVHALFPETADRAPVDWMGVVVDVDGTEVELQMQPEQVWLPDLERPAEGGVLKVGGVTLREPGTQPYAC